MIERSFDYCSVVTRVLMNNNRVLISMARRLICSKIPVRDESHHMRFNACGYMYCMLIKVVVEWHFKPCCWWQQVKPSQRSWSGISSFGCKPSQSRRWEKLASFAERKVDGRFLGTDMWHQIRPWGEVQRHVYIFLCIFYLHVDIGDVCNSRELGP